MKEEKVYQFWEIYICMRYLQSETFDATAQDKTLARGHDNKTFQNYVSKPTHVIPVS